jgi:hypothetical protein
MNKNSIFLRWLGSVMLGLFLLVGTSQLYAQNRNINGSNMTTQSTFYTAGATGLVLNFTTNIICPDGPLGEWVGDVAMDFPAGVTVTAASIMADMPNYLNWEGQTGNGVNTTWTAPSYGNYFIDEDVAPFTVTVNVDPGFTGDMTIGWTIYGEVYGAAPHTMTGTVTIIEPQPLLRVTPLALSLGFRPIGAWMEPAVYSLENIGVGPITVNAGELDAPAFFAVNNPLLPYTLEEGETVEVGISTPGDAVPGALAGNYVAQWGAGRSVTVASFTATAYTPIAGDVVENALTIAIAPILAPVEIHSASTRESVGFYKNYVLPNDLGTGVGDNDIVYKLTTATDVLVDIFGVVGNPNFAIYAEDFGGEAGPMATNALAQGQNAINDFPMYTGTYYLVGSAIGAWGGDYFATAMPNPTAVTYIAPFDGEFDITNGDDLVWSFGANTLEYQVILGTTYPPSTVVVDWTSDLATTYTLTNTLPNLQYFWQVNARNNNGSTAGAIWGFTTTLTPPADLTGNAEVYEGQDVVLTWTSPVDRAFLGYNVYRDGVKVNASLLTATTYTDAAPAYNMGGYDYNVTAVFDEGESDYSDTFTAQVTGEGSVSGNVKDLITTANIEGAAIELSGVDEFGVDQYYTFTTNAGGNYTGAVLAGVYDYSVVKEGYIAGTLADVAVAYGANVANNFTLLEQAYPVAFVIASELNETSVLLEWGFDLPSFVPQQYPFDTKGLSDAKIASMWNDYIVKNGLNTTTTSENRAFVEFQVWREKVYQPGAFEQIGTTMQTQFVDFDWGVQTWGVYKWYVVAVYDLNQSAPVGSNSLDMDMNTTVDVTVALNSANSPAGTFVEFTNVDESPELVYSTLLPASGTYTWDSFRKGTYDIQVSLPGYLTITETGVDIFDVTSFEWLLEEILAAPADLYVTPTGFATWQAGVFVPFAPVLYDFEADAQGWNVQGDLTGWQWGDNASLSSGFFNFDGNETNFLAVNADKAGSGGASIFAVSTSPTMDLSGLPQAYVAFDYTLYWDFLSVYYSVAGDVPVLLEDLADTDGLWTSHAIELPAEALVADVQLIFLFDENGTWGYGGAFDNVLVTNVSPVAPRAFETYKLFLDGTLLGEVSGTEYQHGGFGETMVDGQVYFTEVAAVYSTGQSASTGFTWKYVACENYDAPTAFVAAQVIGTLNVQLDWTNVDAAALDTVAALHIHRNGEELAVLDFTAGSVDTYVDASLEFGTYNYCLTYIYDSGAETCVDGVCADAVTITGGGFVNGTVTAFDGGLPIAGATVTVANGDYSFEFTTDAAGFYEGEVVDGTYDYFVVADNFEAQTLAGVVIVYGATVTNNFSLLEFPFPVRNVVAEDRTTNALITWNTPGAEVSSNVYEEFSDGMPELMVLDTPTANWSVANDFLNFNGTGTAVWRSAYYNAAYTDALYEVEMQKTAGSQTSSMGIYVRGTGFAHPTPGNGEYANVFTITQSGSYWYATMLNGDLMGDWTGWLSSSAINTSGPNVITAVSAGTTVQFLVNGTLVHTVSNTTLTEGFCGMFAYDGDVNTTVWDYLSIVPGAVARDYATNNVSHETKGNLNEVYVSYENTVEPKGVKYHTPKVSSNRELIGYNVYRTTCNVANDLTFIGFTLDSTFVDNQFGSLESNVYKWAVEATYTNNNAEPQFSNCLDKDMTTQVSVTVTTNSLDSPEGTDVIFTNTSEPELELAYETTLDATGVYAWSDFRKGTYDIYVEKNGFAPVSLTAYVIDGPESFVWILEELLLPVADLYVNPTGLATWREGGIIPFAPFAENFDAGLPETWTVVDGGSTSDTWYNETNYDGNSVDGTPFMFANSDAAGPGSTMDEQLISPVIDAQNADALFLMFDYVYQYIGTEHFSADVFDGSDWVEVFNTQADSGPFPWGPTVSQSIDVTEFANDLFQVRFNYVSNGWNWYVALDNVVVTDNADRYADRELMNYKVWLDGVFVTDTENTFHQYDQSTLVPGQEYFAEVAAVYTNGMSAKMNYTWTYIPCEDFAGPAVYNGEVIDNTDVLLTWSDVVPLELIQITQNPGAPANGYFQFYGNGYGVAYDLSAYPDALVSSLNFHHASWGTTGTWDYNIHVYNWDTKTLIGTYGPFQTTGNDLWENGVQLGDISTGGASMVALLMEPLSNDPSDAYPCISSDSEADPQGSIYGPLDDVNAIGSSTIGNFLMEMYIYTAYGAVKATPVNFDLVQAPAAQARVASNNVPVIPVINQTATVVTNRVVDPFMGANIYKDGVMIAEMVADTFYYDMAVAPGTYNYCLTYVYESGAESCMDANCVELEITEDCVVPEELTATIDAVDPNLVHLLWDQGSGAADWLFYDDGVNVDGIGGPASFSWAVKFDPAQLTEFDGASVTKISIYNRLTSVNTLQIYEGTDAATLLFEQDLTGLTVEAWNEVTLTAPVLLDVTKQLWITVYTTDGASYPAGCGNATGDPNGDLITLDGSLWEHLSDYGLPYTWNLRAFVTDAKGHSTQMGDVVSNNVYNTTDAASIMASGKVNVSEGAAINMSADASRAFMGYNIYKDGEVIVSLHPDNFYDDTEMQIGVHCYTVTAVYSLCGESDPSNEACVPILIGLEEQLGANTKMYPNPATNNVTIESASMKRVVVANAVGQVVFDAEANGATKVTLNTTTFEGGVYVVRIETAEGVVTRRVTIVR